MSNQKPKPWYTKLGEWCNKYKVLVGAVGLILAAFVTAFFTPLGTWLFSSDEKAKVAKGGLKVEQKAEQNQDSSSKVDAKVQQNPTIQVNPKFEFRAPEHVQGTASPIKPIPIAVKQRQFVPKWSKLKDSNGRDWTDFQDAHREKSPEGWVGRVVGRVEGMEPCLRIDFGTDGIEMLCDCYLIDSKELVIYRDVEVGDTLTAQQGRLTIYGTQGLQFEDCRFFPPKD